MRFGVLWSLLLLLLTFASATVPLLAAQIRQPNLLFILTEDQGAHLGFVGTPGVQTPGMDSLARSGVYFNNAFVAYSVCSPSKAAIYTGLPNHQNGILNNTPNYHKPASQLTASERNNSLYQKNRVKEGIPTLVERLHDAGYYQGVTSKLHVAPVEKFPYDEFIRPTGSNVVAGFIQRATQTGKPWHLFYNVSESHRPFPNSDKEKIRVTPVDVKLPAFLADTPVVRKDWAEYLAAIEEADAKVAGGLAALRASGQETNTIIVFLGDHGPAFPHGKMTLYDLGLRTPLVIRVPWLKGGFRTDALASEIDLSPTLLDLLGLPPLPGVQGRSLKPVLTGEPGAKAHDYIFAEISDRGVLPNDGMQERSVCDGRWHLIYREKLTPAWRQVNADSQFWKPWGNRNYDETVRVKDRFPVPYRILAEQDPQNLGGTVRPIELYDLKNDPDEIRDLAGNPEHRAELERLYAALRQWVRDTEDPAVKPPEKVETVP
jgi:N-sulfoglucosamine sulfohydrolase